jgi:very-short-patch-repair endonuclease
LLGVGPEFAPQFSDSDIVRRREARRDQGKDIHDLDASLPQLIEFPDSKALLEVHQDLSQFERLQQGVERGDVPTLADSSQETLVGAHQAVESWKAFLARPVTTPLGIEVDADVHRALANLRRTLVRAFGRRGRRISMRSRGSAKAPPARDTFAQRFNVADSRARDRMYLVRSVEPEHLSQADRLRRSLIAHFASPFAQDEMRVEDLRRLCESPFEREMYDDLTQRGYWVTPQVRVGEYRIDMVAEGHNDARLAIECDGDKYHGADKWADDMQRQRVLERAGWVFWRCFASAFIRKRKTITSERAYRAPGRAVRKSVIGTGAYCGSRPEPSRPPGRGTPGQSRRRCTHCIHPETLTAFPESA